jgi:hypothetical protein
MDRWVAPTNRGIDRAFAAMAPKTIAPGGYVGSMTRAVRGNDLPSVLGGGGGVGRFGGGAADTISRLGGKADFQKSFGDPIQDRFNATDNYLAGKFDFWAGSAPGDLFGGGSQTQQPGQQQPGGSYGAPGSLGGDWAGVDKWNSAVSSAAAKWGVDPNRLKAHMKIESDGNPNAVQNNPTYGNTYGLMQINPAIWDATLKANGINMFTPEGNIEAAAFILQDNYKRYGDWDKASSAFFVGNPNWVGADTVNGTTGGGYRGTLNTYMQQLSAAGGGSTYGQVGGGTGNASSVIQTATSFVGKVPYVWGGIPGKGQTPTGWDCSGFTYWLDQNYGSGTLARGSHYQYQQAVNEGRLKRDPSQLQAGDLVFFDTGNRAGGGANLNAAGHVGMYIGNGKMVHAANRNDGTIISDIGQYMNMYGYLGAMQMSWSGGGGYTGGTGGGGGYGSPAQNYYNGSTGSYLSALYGGRL